VECAGHGSIAEGRGRFWSIDTVLLCDLLRYETAGRSPSTAFTKITSKSLVPRAETSTRDPSNATIDYNLVGSAGISAHRTAPREAPINAPGGASSTPELQQFSTASQPHWYGGEVQETSHDTFVDGFWPSGNDSALFLEPTDYLRSIEDCFNITAE
jgi:hypothetical protein